MSKDIEEALETGFQDAKNSETGMIIISPVDNSRKFLQFEITEETAMLDFPVLSTNKNTSEEADLIREHISDHIEDLKESPAGGEGFNATLDRDVRIAELTE